MAEGVQQAPSLLKKAETASVLCTINMLPSRQNTEHERNVVAMSNECRKAYHPDDIDFGAAVVREKFCGCFASGMIDAATHDGEFTKGLMAYSAGRGKLSAGVTKIVNQLTDYCSQRL